MNSAPPQSATGFWSIERAVAFVIGPSVTALSGWLSLFVAKKWGIHIGGPELLGIFSTGGLSAAGLAYKWLHGRQTEQSLLPFATGVAHDPLVGDFIHTTLHDLEGLAQSAAARAAGAVTGSKPEGKAVEVGDGPPIPSAVGDPAPASMAADQGAASGE